MGSNISFFVRIKVKRYECFIDCRNWLPLIIAHERLREELGREPTQEEADEWLNEQTEGY